MALPNTLRQNKGFTLIEILIALAILVVIFSLGLFISWDFYKSYSSRPEISTIVSILQKARSQSADNINQARHGVHFNNPLQYVLFECFPGVACTDYTGHDASKDLVINPTSGISVTSGDIVFEQLTGNCINPGNITITTNGRNETITINSQGRIDW